MVVSDDTIADVAKLLYIFKKGIIADMNGINL
jgi:hypothetical protein